MTSATKTGTPALESCSAMPCRVLVLPVPVAPATRPWRLSMPSGTRDDGLRDHGAVVNAAAQVEGRPVRGVGGRDRLAEVGHQAAPSCVELQNAHLRAAWGISLRHSGHVLVSGSWPRFLRSAILFIGRTTT